jgi:hypothetical protein
MTDPALIKRCANEVLDRVVILDDTVSNARAFRSLLEELHRRDLRSVEEPHVTAIKMVRAAVLRAAIGTTMACLDPSDWRGNRASVGQILEMLKDTGVVAVFPAPGAAQESALEEARHAYSALTEGNLFEHGRRLRNDAVTHVLIQDTPTPDVAYETFYQLHDVAEELVRHLYRVCYRRRQPRFIELKPTLIEHSRIFWNTYFQGIGLGHGASQR